MARKKESYESMLKQLEQIVNKMDSETLSLEESLKNYEEGIRLCKELNKTLNETEQKVKILTSEGEQIFTEGKE